MSSQILRLREIAVSEATAYHSNCEVECPDIDLHASDVTIISRLE